MRQKKPFPPPFYRPPSVPDWLISAAGTNCARRSYRGRRRTPRRIGRGSRRPSPPATGHPRIHAHPRLAPVRLPARRSPPNDAPPAPIRHTRRPSNRTQARPASASQRLNRQHRPRPKLPPSDRGKIRPCASPALRRGLPRNQRLTQRRKIRFHPPRHLGNSLPGLAQLRSRRRLRA